MIPRYIGGAASIEALTGALEPLPDDDQEEELLALAGACGDLPETPSEASGGDRYAKKDL